MSLCSNLGIAVIVGSQRREVGTLAGVVACAGRQSPADGRGKCCGAGLCWLGGLPVVSCLALWAAWRPACTLLPPAVGCVGEQSLTLSGGRFPAQEGAIHSLPHRSACAHVPAVPPAPDNTLPDTRTLSTASLPLALFGRFLSEGFVLPVVGASECAAGGHSCKVSGSH